MTCEIPPQAFCRLYESEDIDQYARAQQGWTLHYEQLSPGRFYARQQQVQLPQVTLVREYTRQSMRQRGHLDDGVYGFAMALQDQSGLYFNGQRVHDGSIMCGRGDELDLTTPPEFTLIALVVERGLLNPLWEHMYHKPLANWLENKLALPTTATKAQALRDLHLAVLDQAASLALRPPNHQALLHLRDEILMEWMEALPSKVDLSEMKSLERRKKLVDKACELMLAHADEPLSILQICSRVGTSRRKLNYSFQDVLGTTPLKYLRHLRLNGVRRALRNAQPGSTVQDLAAQWGFWHLSQFAQDYKRLFGELPSTTLNQR
jgi:AraC family ethanolamine operon transcriptional activator